jgi:hypothetical protein
MKKIIILGLIAFGLAVTSGIALAQDTETILNFTGFMYESDNTPGAVGYPPSNPGDILAAVGFIEDMSQPLEWSPDEYQYTIYMDDLVSAGEVDIGGGTFYITYDGGFVDIVAQRYDDPGYTMPDYGIEPPNATAPSTFTDGEIYLHGYFYMFYMLYYPSLHVGNFEGLINWTLHPDLGELFNPEGNVFAGTVDPLMAPVPDGYDFEMDGHVTFDPTIPNELKSWGGVKNLYR